MSSSEDAALEAVVRAILRDLKLKFKLSDAHCNLIAKDIEEIAAEPADRRAQIVQAIEKEIAGSEYAIDEQVGSGAFGSVFKGTRRKDGKQVAIKIIDLEESKDDVQTICREITTLVSSSCPQLINYYGSAVFGTKLWIAMEFVDGGSILDKIKKQSAPLNEEQIAYVVHEVLLGLDYLSRSNKIHRDIKAANILLSKSGQVKLADFGATAQLTDTMTKCSTFVGSPYWMAPEVMTQPSYDAKADIWSLGVTCLLSSEPVLMSDGKTISAGEVREGMLLAGQDGPVTVTRARPSVSELPKSKEFYRVTIDNKNQDSFVVTRDHIMTVYVNDSPSIIRHADGNAALEVGVIDPRDLSFTTWSTRTSCSSSSSRVDTPAAVAAAAAVSEAEARAMVWSEFEKEAEADPESLVGRVWTKGSVVDVPIQLLVDHPDRWDQTMGDARPYLSLLTAGADVKVIQPPSEGHVIAAEDGDKFKDFRFVGRDHHGRFTYRPLSVGDRVNVVVVLHNGPKQQQQESADGSKSLALVRLERAMMELGIPVGEAGGLVITELNPTIGEMDSNPAMFESMIKENMHTIVHELGATHIVAFGEFNKYRWQYRVDEMVGVSNIKVVEEDTLVEFNATNDGRLVKVFLGWNPCWNMNAAREALIACYGIPEVTVGIKSISKVDFAEPQTYAPFAVDGNNRFVVGAGIVTHNCYEMAFGHPPNANVHPLKVTMLIPRLPAPEVGANFSADFQAFVKACCVKNPAQRPDIPTLLKMPFVAKAPQLQGKALTWD